MNRPYADEAPIRRVAIVLVLLVGAVALVLAAVAALVDIWGAGQSPALKQGEPLQGRQPALETAPQRALQAYLSEKRRIAESYDWIDESRSLARIPIEVAMRALAECRSGSARATSAYLMGGTRQETGTPDARMPAPGPSTCNDLQAAP